MIFLELLVVEVGGGLRNLRAVLARRCERRGGPARAPTAARAAQRAGMDSLSTTLSRFRAVQEATAHNNAAIDLLHVGR